MRTERFLPCLLLILLTGGIAPAAQSGAAGGPQAVHLPQLSPHERQRFYHATQGSRFMPYEWFVHLQRHDRPDRFIDDLVPRYGFVPNVGTPDKLPVGFTTKRVNGKDYIGFNCAACHTGQLNFQGRTLVIDGGASMQNNLLFFQDMLAALIETYVDSERFSAFAAKVLPAGAPPEARAKLRQSLYEVYDESSRPNRIALLRGMNPFPVIWGRGRIDANGRASNAIFMKLDPENVQPSTGPASIPSLWGALEYDRVQWNGSIQNPMARNIAPTLALGLGLWDIKLSGAPAPTVKVETAVSFEELDRLENLVREIQAPIWPFDRFDETQTIKFEEAKRGKSLFAKLCARCHVPDPLPGGHFGQRYRITMVPLSVIGTDPAHATSFAARRVRAGALKHLAGSEILSAPEAIRHLTSHIMEHPSLPQSKWREARPNDWRAPLEYMARPLNGIWATPPYLHNGSVPNLYEVLSPATSRSKTFCFGQLDYDPEKVGYKTDHCVYRSDDRDKERPFDTLVPGNFNYGHEFRSVPGCEAFGAPGPDGRVMDGERGVIGCEIKPEDRKAIVEYLKTCDLKLPWTPGELKPADICVAELEPAGRQGG